MALLTANSSIASRVRAPRASVRSRASSLRESLSGGWNIRRIVRADIAARDRRGGRVATAVRAADDGNFLDKLNPFKAMEKAKEKNDRQAGEGGEPGHQRRYAEATVR